MIVKMMIMKGNLQVHKVMAGMTGLYSVEVRIENVKIRMEVVTGAAVSMMSSKTCQAKLELHASSVTFLKTYTNEVMSVIVEADVNVAYAPVPHLLTLYTVEDNGWQGLAESNSPN